MDLKIPYSKFKNGADAYRAIKELPLPEEVNGQKNCDDGASTIRIEAQGCQVVMAFKAKQVEIDTKFPLLKRPFKGLVLGELRKKLEQYL